SITSVIRSGFVALLIAMIDVVPTLAQVTNPQQGSVGLQGTIPTDPPTQGATISFPTDGQSFGTSPITVRGLCPPDLLVKIFKNQVFAGSVYCTPGGTFEIEIDLFSGANAIVARVFDALDQPGPDSNIVNVTFNDSNAQEGVDELILTSNFATRGADPYKTLTWPLAVSGGIGPYAVSVDWGDGVNDLSTLDFAGNFDIEHIYTQPGVYKVIVRVADSRGETAFLQLVAIANGPTSQDVTGDGAGGTNADEPTTGLRTQFVVWPIYIMLFFAVSTFWIGRRYEIRRIRYKLAHNERVEF
ncbi:MAG: PKD domain-containing protein, partial [Candidatus Saccharimonadales bacterium]|nr:PKD domain-containing protein [Candidatus Saccharimonadales bacterium]